MAVLLDKVQKPISAKVWQRLIEKVRKGSAEELRRFAAWITKAFPEEVMPSDYPDATRKCPLYFAANLAFRAYGY